jgi:hypothetical protein
MYSFALQNRNFNKLMPFIRIILISLLFIRISDNTTNNKSTFISPLNIPLALSASFGELRADHFHSGIDIKTQGVTGKEVMAAAQGYVYRISISPGGFGKALYIRHPSGYSTVYGHLDRFIPEIEDYVKARQYEKKSFMVNLYPQKDKFPVRQGDIVAYSGNSGSSGGPHLHYEIRKSDGEIPVNPLFFDFGITDHVRPVIQKLVIYPINRYSLINGRNEEQWVNVRGSGGNYTVSSDSEVDINGLAGFGIKSYDQFDNSSNRGSVYSIELFVDSTSIFKYVMDAFSFSESGYINSHIDYAAYQRNQGFIERTYVLPNDRLSAYKNLINRGIYNFNDSLQHIAEIIVKDIEGNESRLTFSIRSVTGNPADMISGKEEDGIMMPYNRSNSFSAENISVRIPEGALFDTIYFSYAKDKRRGDMFSDLHCVHNIYTPLHKPITLSITPDSVPSGKKSKMLIVRLNGHGIKTATGSYWTGNSISAETSTFGNYYIGIDTVAPEISAVGFSDNSDLSGRNEIKFRISDDLSGIRSYTPIIDGKWALFEYDLKNDVLIYRFDPERISKGTRHGLSLEVSDNRNNTSRYSTSFIW